MWVVVHVCCLAATTDPEETDAGDEKEGGNTETYTEADAEGDVVGVAGASDSLRRR